MIVLDTNVISEVMRAEPNPHVIEWLNRQDSLTLVLATPSIAEIRYGLCCLPAGKRRRALETSFERMLVEGFEGRIWDFDAAAAAEYGFVMSLRRSKGKPLGVVDGQIAALAASRRAGVATRNVRDFEDCGIALVDPFTA